MADTIDDVKDRLRRTFLGKGGIHGFGVSRANRAIRVYVQPDDAPDQADTLEQLRKSAEPFALVVVREDRPRIT
jgi:hypothetical protein